MPEPKEPGRSARPSMSGKAKVVMAIMIVAVMILAVLSLSMQKPVGLVGTWELVYETETEFWLGYDILLSNITYDFRVELRKDGTGVLNDTMGFHWEVWEDKLNLTFSYLGPEPVTLSYDYILDGDTLITRKMERPSVTVERMFRRV